MNAITFVDNRSQGQKIESIVGTNEPIKVSIEKNNFDRFIDIATLISVLAVVYTAWVLKQTLCAQKDLSKTQENSIKELIDSIKAGINVQQEMSSYINRQQQGQRQLNIALRTSQLTDQWNNLIRSRIREVERATLEASEFLDEFWSHQEACYDSLAEDLITLTKYKELSRNLRSYRDTMVGKETIRQHFRSSGGDKLARKSQPLSTFMFEVIDTDQDIAPAAEKMTNDAAFIQYRKSYYQ